MSLNNLTIRQFDREIREAGWVRDCAQALARGVLEGAGTSFSASVLREIVDITNDDYVEALALAAENFLRSTDVSGKYSSDDVDGFIQRVNHPLSATGDTMTVESYPPLAPEAPQTVIAYPVTPFGDMATTDSLSDLTTAELSPEVQAAVNEVYGK